MEAWIVYYRDGAKYNQQYIRFYIEEGNKLGINVKLILVEDLNFGVKNNHWFLHYQNNDIGYPDFVICRAIYPLLSKQFELLGIRVFNNSFVAEICNDKARTYQYLAKTGIKMVDSSFFKNLQVREKLFQATSPTIIKAVDGHGGNQVFSIDEITRNRLNILKGLGNSDVVIQPLIGNRHQDLRVYVIGKEIIAAVLRTAKIGFKSNFSLGGQVALYELSEDEINIVNLIINQFDFDFVGIDFIIGDEGEFIFNEIEDVVGARMLYQCSDINIVERYLRYIIHTLVKNN
ncbi:MAG: ATP-grasp domain-containing protein [Herbinix sp.]|nr:ATP-grasp domain-containing protein [Herbinix sp.]